MTAVLLDFRRPARTGLNCKWIKTGNPKQTLVCVWVDRFTGATTAVPEVDQIETHRCEWISLGKRAFVRMRPRRRNSR